MDVQMKKGLLDLCVLACLKRQDSYGYQIIKDVGRVLEISESALYPVLKRLEAAGQVTTYDVQHNGRLRKYFKITPHGTRKLYEFEKDQEELITVYEFIHESLSTGVGV